MNEEQVKKYIETFMSFTKAMAIFKPKDSIRPGDMFVISCIFELSGSAPHNPGRTPVRMSDISNRMRLSKPAITQSINRLTQMGLIERSSSDEDRRVVFVSFTEEGNKHFKAATSDTMRRLAAVFTAYGEEKTEQLFKHLSELTAIINEKGAFI